MIHLSKRLLAVASMVTEGSRLADIGTDHAYVPIYLCLEGTIPSATAMDVKDGPLKRAVSHINEAGLSDRIEVRLSDGLEALKAGEADTVLIAGMGGALMVRILKEGEEKLLTVNELVLQPQSEIFKVRRFLCGTGWEIAAEAVVSDSGKYYPMFRAVRKKQDEPKEDGKAPYTEADFIYGRVDLQTDKDAYKDFLEFKLCTACTVLEKLPGDGSSEDALWRRQELESEMSMLRKRIQETVEYGK